MSISEEKTPEAVAAERQKARKKLKRRLLPCILAGFSLPVTLFLYGPFDLYMQNRAELGFALGDFLPMCALLAFFCGALLSVIPLFLKKRVYSVYLTVLLWADVMLFVQGSYLNFGVDSLAADGVAASTPMPTVVINTAIWIITLAAAVICVICLKPVRKNLRTALSLILCTVLIMEATGAVAVSLDGEAQDTRKNGMSGGHMLTTHNLTTLSSGKNAVVFIVDRFDASYYREARMKYPQLLSELEGFTSYDNYISLYARTYPGVTSIFTGVENDFSTTRTEYFERAYSQSPALSYMKECGYGINIYTDGYYAYEDARCMAEYADNLSGYDRAVVKDKAALLGSMLALSAYRYFPFVLKGTVDHIGSTTFSSLIEYVSDREQTVYSTENKDVYRQITESDFSLTDEDKRLNLIHISGCHLPAVYDEDWNDLTDKSYSVQNVMTQSFKIISRYISQMKQLGVYEDATIIITGDHAAAISDKKPVEGSRVTAMLVKPSGVSEGEMVSSSAPVCQQDLWRTLLASEGILENAPEDIGGIPFFDVEEGQARERRYVFHRIAGDEDEELIYRVLGDARDFSNWQLISTRKIQKLYK